MKSNVISVKRILTITMAFVMVIVIFTINAYGEEEVLTVNSKAAIVMSKSTGEIIYQKNESDEFDPGSLVKLMTAMVLIDNIKTDKEYNNKVELADGTMMSVENLLYFMLIESSDEAADALADYSMNSVDDFVYSMNNKAASMGLKNTSFINVDGTAGDNQYSSAEDLAEIVKEALSYEIIKDALSRDAYKISDELTLENNSEMIMGGTVVEVNGKERDSKYEGIFAALSGGNGSAMMAAARDDDMEIIAVSLGENNTVLLADMFKLLDYGIKHADRSILVKAGETVSDIKVKHGEVTKIDVVTEGNGYLHLPQGASDKLVRTEIVIEDNLTAPVKKGTVVGVYNIYIADEKISYVNLIVDEDVNVGWFPSYIYISNKASVIIGIVFLIVFTVFITLMRIRRKNLKRRKAIRDARIKELAIRSMEMDEDRKRRNWTYHE